jgi:cytochrome c-type biogenesis protein CcmH/NrfG
MKKIERYLVCAMILLLAGCASYQPVATEPPPPSRNDAVISLLDTARSQSAAGKHDMAGASLERALRIEPQNPELWQELARVRLQQGQYREAENLAAKANILSGADMNLRAENWQIIGQARTRLGDHQGAQAAFEKAEGE